MKRRYHRLLLVFADGVGLAPAGADNPLATAPAPHLKALLGGPLTIEQSGDRDGLVLRPLDARLGVEGLPQSATGQTALFTGQNGARIMGRHVTGLPGPRLRAVIREHGLLRRARDRGLAATFANAYSSSYLDELAQGRARRSVTTCAVQAAGLRFRKEDDLERGEAVTWDIEGDLFGRHRDVRVTRVDAGLAGRRLAGLAAVHDLTIFETFLTDLAGHRRFGITAAEAVGRLDRLIGGILEGLAPGATLLLTSDHGNLEDATTRRHTLHPVPLLVRGRLAGDFADLSSILEVTPRILELLSRASSPVPS